MIDLPRTGNPGDALSQPTRARLFALLGELARPAGTVELAEQLNLHPNGVRVHLERLERDGLLVRESEPQARGRPRDVWKIAPDAAPGGRPPRAYTDLVRWLARATGSGSRGLRGIETAGREIGRELASDRGATGEDALQTTLTALGFQPRAPVHADGRVTICLGNCPYRDAVRENQPVICTLHRGITRGLLDVMAPGVRLTAFEPHDPDRAGCLIKLAEPKVPTGRSSAIRAPTTGRAGGS